MTHSARPYQVEAIEAVQADFNFYGLNKTLLVMATGLGKTFTFCEVARQYPQVLILAHRKELIEQAVDRVTDQLGIVPGIEMGSKRNKGEAIIVGSVQTVVSRPFDLPIPKLIIIDEAHHSVSSTYRTILNRYPQAKVLGVTATPDRTDQLALGNVFESVAYRYETLQGIEDGWLSPVIYGEADGVGGLLHASYGRRTVVFTPDVATAKYVAEELGTGADYVHGAMPKKQRASTLSKFKTGELQYMVNCNILTEGFDCPEIECVAMLRATQSRGLFVQCLGRGLRLAPGKSDCLYLDLTMKMPDHSLQAPPNALDGIYEMEDYCW